LGDGSTIDRASPVTVSGGHAFIMLAAASRPIQPADLGKRSHTCGITTTGKAYCWGSNNVGQLGDGTTTDRLIPTAVSTSEVFAAIGAGDTFTCAMTPNRKVFCWGSNVLGELGSGNIGGFSTIPVAVPPPFR
jgi:alpha-tubulin suppressor-like RCC1 family protein